VVFEVQRSPMLSAKGVATRTIDELLDGLEEDDWAEDELLELEDELEDEPLELDDELLELNEEALELDVTEELAVLELEELSSEEAVEEASVDEESTLSLDEEASVEFELSGDEIKLEEETPRRDPQPERVKIETDKSKRECDFLIIKRLLSSPSE
jgi:hypothetical protein